MCANECANVCLLLQLKKRLNYLLYLIFKLFCDTQSNSQKFPTVIQLLIRSHITVITITNGKLVFAYCQNY